MGQSLDDAKFQKALAAIGASGSADSVRAIMRNAKAQLAAGQLGQPQAEAVQRAGLRRLAELAGQDANDRKRGDEALVRQA